MAETVKWDGDMTADESALLLRELNHRLGNSFQTVLSILSLQAAQLKDAKRARVLLRAVDRVRAIAFVHSPRHASPAHDQIEFGNCLQQIVTELSFSHSFPSSIDLRIDAADIVVAVETAEPLALLASELVSNAFEHAFQGRVTGQVRVVLRYTDSTCNWLELQVSDDGVGIPSSVQFETEQSFGFFLARVMATQMKGTVQIDRDHGTAFRVVIPLE
ncbi:MAG TPA: sensor histidine kinase [Bryobacteraceae bacterium]|nr:sensor histidine kinase [Bryobacteraceae bacterium]